MTALVDAAYAAGLVAASPVLAWRAISGRARQRSDWPARLGRGPSLPTPKPSGRLLVHAVSVGEVNAARGLVERLCADHDVVLSAGTDTGFARARQLFGERIAVVRYPLDAGFAVERFLDRVRPSLVALVELEVWPNFMASCSRRGIAVAVVNGRLSERSFSRYRLVRPLLSRMFRDLRHVCAQTERYADRFVVMGVARDRVHVTGTMKWDTAQIADSVEGADELARALGIDRSRPLVVAGSTAPGEEALLHRSVPPGTQLLCAPRRPEWFDAAAADLPGCVRRSRTGGSAASDRFLLDTIGELRRAYALATVAVVGRSFGTLHGSDMMEPVALGKATLVGPRHGDFQDTADKLAAAGGLRVTDAPDLARELARLLSDPGAREEMARAGRVVIEREQGATVRNAATLTTLLQVRAAHGTLAVNG
jgi:3-deoxy-D-manno-octulosonic-acid transferase